MQMTNEEIAISYRQAKRPRMQVKILAELNDCEPYRILEILASCGALTKATRKSIWKNSRIHKLDYGVVAEYYSKGLTDDEIAREVGGKANTITRWRYKNRLPSHSPNMRGRRNGKFSGVI